MRALVVICAVAGCGGDSGLLLELHPGSADVVSVEVFVPTNDTPGNHMGMPMGTGRTSGTVYTTADRVTADVAGGTASILLKPGSITQVPALLVVGYNASHQAVRYAEITDPNAPNGMIQLPHTHADTIKVELEAIAEVPVAGATSGNPSTGPRLARWSHTMLDDVNGDCVGVLTANGRGGFDGTFFGPSGDLDCDAAMPECDDNWYLKVGTSTMPPQNPLCARDDATPDTMDACRVGDTVACTDNIGDCNPRTQAPVCVPAPVCARCKDQIDPSCFQDGLTSDLTLHVECDLPIGQLNGSAGPTTLCSTQALSLPLDLAPQLGATAGIVSAEFDAPPAITGGSATLPLAGSMTTTLHVGATTTGGKGLTFSAENGTTPGIDPSAPDTPALLVIGVHTGTTRLLVLPFLAHYVPGDCSVTVAGCKVVLGIGTNDQPFNDPIWHCAGN